MAAAVEEEEGEEVDDDSTMRKILVLMVIMMASSMLLLLFRFSCVGQATDFVSIVFSLYYIFIFVRSCFMKGLDSSSQVGKANKTSERLVLLVLSPPSTTT